MNDEKKTADSSESEVDFIENEEDRNFIDDEFSDEESDASSVSSVEHKKAKVEMDSDLDEEDLELIEENLGVKKRSNFKRLKKRPIKSKKVAKTDLEALFKEESDDDHPSDGIDDFVVYEEQPKARATARGAPKQKTSKISADKWSEMIEIFGDGTDYLYALDEEEEIEEAVTMGEAFEPGILIEKMVTPEDKLIREVDIPERIQQSSFFEQQLAPGELDAEVKWVIDELKKRRSEPTDESEMRREIGAVLRFIREEHLEVPFISAHRKEYTEHLSLEDLWAIYDLDESWKSLKARLDKIKSIYAQIATRLDLEDPYIPDLLAKAVSDEDINDLHSYLHLHFEQELIDLKNETSDDNRKRPIQRSDYFIAKAGLLKELTRKIAISAQQFGENLATGYRKSEPHDLFEKPEDIASKYVSSRFPTVMTVMQAAKTLISNEIACDPCVRKLIRGRLYDSATISTFPTARGIKEINANHEYAHIKYVTAKPICTFSEDYFFDFLKASESGLLDVKIAFSQHEEFVQEICSLVCSDAVSGYADQWNLFRRSCVRVALEDILHPLVEKEIWNHFTTKSANYVGYTCQNILQDRIAVANFKAVDSEGIPVENPKIMAVSWGDGSLGTATFCVMLDSYGNVLDHIKLGNMQDRDKKEEDISEIRKLLATFQPHAIAIAGTSVSTRNLFNEINRIAQEAHSYHEVPHQISVTLLEDDVARIYQVSDKANQEFPKSSQLLKYCISLGRRLIDPILEFAALANARNDIVCLPLHPSQNSVPHEILLKFLRRAFITVVSVVGIDINEAAKKVNAEHLLQFVSGLGPRKAQTLLQTVQKTPLDRRVDLLKKDILGPCVYKNCASFLKILEETHPNSENADFDALDRTRIHPENYQLARKMVADALEIDAMPDDDIGASQHVIEIMAEPSKLNDLLLDDYAAELERRQNMLKKLTLQDIRTELQDPYNDIRVSVGGLPDTIAFTMLTGEDERSLRIGQIVSAHVTNITEKCIYCKLDSGLTGVIPARLISDQECYSATESGINANESLLCKVTDIFVEKFQVELSFRQSDLQTEIAPFKALDPNYDEDRRRRDAPKEALVPKRLPMLPHKSIAHPLFKNVDRAQAEAALSAGKLGQIIIRPNSKGYGCFSVSWKVAPNVFQHIDVTTSTEGKRNFLINNDSFEDIDEIIARHLEPMIAFTREILSHPKYSAEDEKTLVESLVSQKKANPNRIFYAIHCNLKSPGRFFLSYIPGRTFKHEVIIVTPHGFRFRDQFFNSVNALINWFKVNQGSKQPTLVPANAQPDLIDSWKMAQPTNLD